MKYVIVDTETTGLDHNKHRAFEFSWYAFDSEEGIDMGRSPMTFYSMLSTREAASADPTALEINGRSVYWLHYELPALYQETAYLIPRFIEDIKGATLVGANVRFDARMIMQFLGYDKEPWSHRLLDIQAWIAGRKGSLEIPSLREIWQELKVAGYVVTEPNHSSREDVKTVRDILYHLT